MNRTKTLIGLTMLNLVYFKYTFYEYEYIMYTLYCTYT